MTRLILHAGTHKTGTSAIQSFARTHRAALLARGWLYPGLAGLAEDGTAPHHIFAHALAGRSELVTALDAMDLPRAWAEEAERHGADLFLSAEPFYRHVLQQERTRGDWLVGRRRYLARLAKVLAPFEVEVLLVYRRPDDFVRSLFQENMTKPPKGEAKWADFAAFRRHAANGALRYAESAVLFAERFPRVRCLIYEDFAGDPEFCRRILAEVGIDAGRLAEAGVVRRSLTPAATLAKCFLNQAPLDERQNAKVLKWLKSPAAAELIAEHLGAGPFDLWESQGARQALLDARAEDLERLRLGFLPDRPVLFPPLDPAGPPPVPEFPAALKTALLRKAPLPAAAKAAVAVKAERPPAPAVAPAVAVPLAAPAVNGTPHPAGDAITGFALIIGAMKCGTTSLYNYLATHPEIAPCVTKEPNFFVNPRLWRQGPAHYRGMWPAYDPDRHRLALEASGNYTKFPMRRKVPRRMARLGAAYKFLYIVRDPIDRIESHLAHSIAHGRVEGGRAFDLVEGPLAVSCYGRQLRQFTRVFPRESLLVLDFDDLRDRPAELLAALRALPRARRGVFASRPSPPPIRARRRRGRRASRSRRPSASCCARRSTRTCCTSGPASASTWASGALPDRDGRAMPMQDPSTPPPPDAGPPRPRPTPWRRGSARPRRRAPRPSASWRRSAATGPRSRPSIGR